MFLGNRRLMDEEKIELGALAEEAERLKGAGRTVVHVARGGDILGLVAIADAPPPAAMSMFKAPARISSMTWMAEFLTDEITTRDGWFLARHVAETARHGYSSQAMTLWNANGQPVMVGRQTIAIFG